MSESAQSLEAALSRLEHIIEEIEAGQLELDEALSRFEEGVALVRQAGHKLDAAETRVQQLLADGETWTLHPFSTPE